MTLPLALADPNPVTPGVPVGLGAADWADIKALLPLAAAPPAQQAYLKASTPDSIDQFGYSVAVSGDTVVIGAPYESSNATGVNGDGSNNLASSSGAAYVFIRSGNTWSQQAYLKASNTKAGDNFGWSTAISGDTVVIGASYESSSATGVNGDGSNNSASKSGAAYVFTRSGSTWSQQAYLKASNTGAGDNFGRSIAISGDTVVAGASGESSNASGVNGDGSNNSAAHSGAAYVFTRSGSTWSQQAYLKASNTGASDRFGYSAAVSGDTVVVGALDESSSATGVGGNQADNSASSSGAAYVFTRSGTNWSQQAYIKASNTAAGNNFGASVAVSGDTFVVGAEGESSSATGVNGDGSDNASFPSASSGAAYVFTRSGNIWSQQAYLKASNTTAGAYFGWSTAISGNTVVVGSPYETSSATGINGNQSDHSATNSGAAYMFTRSGSTWSQQAYLKASNTNAGDYFGWSASVSGDTVVSGAIGEASNASGVNGDEANNSLFRAGAAYVFAVDITPASPPSVASTNLSTTYSGSGPSSFSVNFSKAVNNAGGGSGAEDVTNPANFLVVNKGPNGIADTISCKGGVVADDTRVPVAGVSYDSPSFTATVSFFSPLPPGAYRLFICGTTSIVDLSLTPLNNGTDYPVDFVVQSSSSSSNLPKTGFAPGRITRLSAQPAAAAYTPSDLLLEIPAIQVKTAIVGVPRGPWGWDVTWLGQNAGWLNGSAYPTLSGNSVLTGHVWDANNQPGLFANLKSLKYGDRIMVHAFDQVYTYEVRESERIEPGNVWTALKHEDQAWLTLLTCEDYQFLRNTYSGRRMVRAVLVSVQ